MRDHELAARLIGRRLAQELREHIERLLGKDDG
jgi:hypothetical protein